MATIYSRAGRNTADSETGKFYQNEESSNAEKNQLYQNPFFTNFPDQLEKKKLDSSIDDAENIQDDDLNEEFNYGLKLKDMKKEIEVPKQQETKAFNFSETPRQIVSEEKEKIEVNPFLEPEQQRFLGPIRFVEDSTYHHKDQKSSLAPKIERSIFPSEKKEERRVEFMENKFVEAITYNPTSMEKREIAEEELDKLRNSSILFKNLGPQEVEMVYKMKSLKMG